METIKELFSARWCGPCSVLKNKLKKTNIEIDTFDIDECMDKAKERQIKSVPTLYVKDETGKEQYFRGIEDIYDYLTKSE